MRTLPREPWRGSMICGWQVSFGDWGHPIAFCAERKADGLPMCRLHHAEALADSECGHVHMAPGNAMGEPRWSVRLLWEPEEGDQPVEPSYEEMVRYAAIQRGSE